MKKKVRVAVIDNSLDPSLYNPVNHWSAFLDVPWESFRPMEGRFPDLKQDFTHIILTGSEASIMEREPWVVQEVEFVREAVAGGLPILGSCYGHQLLALALRGPAQVRRCPHPEVGWIPISIKEKNSLLGDQDMIYAFAIHFDEVVTLDEEFTILASTERCPIQAFELKGRPIWGVQFHPEINIPQAKKFLQDLIPLGLKTTSYFKEALLSPSRDSGVIKRIVQHFLTS